MLELRREKTGRIQVIGHRGAMGCAPENTFPSFEFGVLHGADILELDIHLSRDGEVVVIHDATLDRTTNGHGYVRDHTLSELKRLDAGASFGDAYAGARIPTFAELLEWSHDRTTLAVEIKADYVRYPDIEEKVVELLARYDAVDQVIMISFDHTTLRKMKRLEPNVAIGPLYRARPVDPIYLMRTASGDVMRP